MKTRLLTLLLSLCLLPMFTISSARAQAPNSAAVTSEYDIQIANGRLLLAPLKSADTKAFVGAGDSVDATVGNLAKYLRAVNTNLNLVVSSGAVDVKINDLKLRTEDMNAVTAALYVATDGNVNGRPLPGKNVWSIMDEQPANASRRTLEVFNLSGYIKTLNTQDGTIISEKLDAIKTLTAETLVSLYGDRAEQPELRYHIGTGLLIVTGTPDAINVARKIITALPGQQSSSSAQDFRQRFLDDATTLKAK